MRATLLPCLALVLACTEPPRARGVHLVFRNQPLGDSDAAFRALLDRFERTHPGVTVEAQPLPNASDVAHQYFLTALEGGATDFDVLVADVIWVPEFAKAGWIADLSSAFPPAQIRRDFFPATAEAVVVDGRTYAVPWYVDVGLLFYRTDLVPRAPRTYEELEEDARAAMAAHPGLLGYLWQGRQYQGLDCNVAEAIWGHGGTLLENGRLTLDTPQARAALDHLRSLLLRGISPPLVTSAAEEESRAPFQQGRAVFLRNWPYVWAEAQREGSPIRGKVGFAPLPTESGAPGAGVLGGWQLALNAHAPPDHREAAIALIDFLTSPESTLALALAYARNPPRPAVYSDPRLREQAPFIAALQPIIENARPRPVTPYYGLISDELQSEFSAAVSGIRPSGEALERAQTLVDHLAEQR
jgi:multiple sugar transport system substrate-binding protein